MLNEMLSGDTIEGIGSSAKLESSIDSATLALLEYQRPDGHWVFELEADCTIPAEYVLLRHYLAEPVDAALEAKIAVYLRRVQGAHGGWPLVHEGAFDMSASVKAYFALKMIGDSVDAPHMVRAREAILARGGAIHSNVFTRFMLAMFGVLTWRSVPVLPVEIMLLPMWSPFHLNKISYWARTTIVPLLVLAALKPRARNPNGVGIDELFQQACHAASPARLARATAPVSAGRRPTRPAGANRYGRRLATSTVAPTPNTTSVPPGVYREHGPARQCFDNIEAGPAQ